MTKQVLYECRWGKFHENPNRTCAGTTTPLTWKQYLTNKERIMDWRQNDKEGWVLPEKDEKEDYLFKRNPNEKKSSFI